jgi:hypothetical protein
LISKVEIGSNLPEWIADKMTGDFNKTKAHKPSPRMRSLFREEARSIIARDRYARSKGLSQNTIGEITTAMTKAYILGQQALIDERKQLQQSSRIDWLDVPPRARDTLRSMTWSFSHRYASVTGKQVNHATAKANEIEKFEVDARTRWAIVINDEPDQRMIADGSVAPLVRLGVLRSLADLTSRYELTEKGLELCRDYWRRFDANDPTLPLESVRLR